MPWPRPLRSWRDHPWRFLAVALLLALLVAGGERWVLGRRDFGHRACWIWAPGDYGAGEPIAFYAVREVELGPVRSARLAISADETYLLYVNGQRLGAGSYRRKAPVDEYEVSDYLQEGVNRILVELRSARGAGGLLAELVVEEGSAAGSSRVVVTDDAWRIFRRYDPGLFGGWAPLAGGEAAKVWQRPPTGRWRPGETRVRRPIPFEGFPPSRRRRPVRFRQQNPEPWVDLTWQGRIPALGPHQLYDWGEEVAGLLSLDLTSDGGEPGLLYFGFEPPNPQVQPPDEVLLPVPGRHCWESAYPQQFRYMLVVGAEPYGRVEVDLLEGGDARGLGSAPGTQGGIFGLAPPRRYSQVEEDVYDRLGHRAGRDGSGRRGRKKK